jgi:hypothetical protein
MGRMPQRFWQGRAIPVWQIQRRRCMFTPVVARLETFAIPVSRTTQTYMNAIFNAAAFVKWKSDSAAEKWIVPEDEVD